MNEVELANPEESVSVSEVDEDEEGNKFLAYRYVGIEEYTEDVRKAERKALLTELRDEMRRWMAKFEEIPEEQEDLANQFAAMAACNVWVSILKKLKELDEPE